MLRCWIGGADAGSPALIVPFEAEVLHHEIGGAERDGKQGGNFAAKFKQAVGDGPERAIAADDDHGADLSIHVGEFNLFGAFEAGANGVSVGRKRFSRRWAIHFPRRGRRSGLRKC